jgi:hypothetical protein
MEETDRERVLAEIRAHQQEIERLSWEIWWLDEVAGASAESRTVREQLARELQYTNARLTQQRIQVALLSSRLAPPRPPPTEEA